MKKLNNKGYVLVEIIMAFTITFVLLYFMMDLVIKMKNKNDDLLVETLVRTDSTIITNGLMDYAIEKKNNFDCSLIKLEGQKLTYNNNVLDIVSENANVSLDASDGYSCNNDDNLGKISIHIPVIVNQMKDNNFDIIIDYRYSYEETFIISYDANGGSGVPSDGMKLKGENYLISDVIPVRGGYTFLGWNSDKDATTAKYLGGDSYSADENLTLYAIWSEIPEEDDDTSSNMVTPIGSYKCANKTVGTAPYVMEYTGKCEVKDDGNGQWTVKFLSTGSLTFTGSTTVEAFLVGGGAGGSVGSTTYGGSGGGGGKTKKLTAVSITSGTKYNITVGKGGASNTRGNNTVAFDNTVNGGSKGGGGSGTMTGTAGNGSRGTFYYDYYYGAGGGGGYGCGKPEGRMQYGTAGTGGQTGGGNGASEGCGNDGTTPAGGSARANTGAGGGGGAGSWHSKNGPGGVGGDGVVIIRGTGTSTGGSGGSSDGDSGGETTVTEQTINLSSAYVETYSAGNCWYQALNGYNAQLHVCSRTKGETVAGGLYTKDMYDLTNYSKIQLRFTGSHWHSEDGKNVGIYIGLVDSRGNYVERSYKDFDAFGYLNKTVSIDISSYKGKYYIDVGFWAYRSSSASYDTQINGVMSDFKLVS